MAYRLTPDRPLNKPEFGGILGVECRFDSAGAIEAGRELWCMAREALGKLGAIPIFWLYLAVFVLDWAQVFPQTPDAMGLGLGLVDFFGAMCCAYGLVFAHQALAESMLFDLSACDSTDCPDVSWPD